MMNESIDNNKDGDLGDTMSEEEGYDSDGTSSFDSREDVWYSRMTLEILHGDLADQPTVVCGIDVAADGRRVPDGDSLASPTMAAAVNRCRKVRDESPDTIDQLCQATRQFYAGTSPGTSEGPTSADIAPLLEDGLTARMETSGGPEKKRKIGSGDAELELDEYPKPSRNTTPQLNDMGSNQVPFPLSPSVTISFREALSPTDKPRLVCLSFPPFLVVHANLAYMNFTGRSSHQILGRPLHVCLGGGCQEQFSSSVTAMHDRIVSLAAKPSQSQESTRCFLKVSLVGPEHEGGGNHQKGNAISMENDDLTEDDTGRFVTHYGVELEPITSGHDVPSASIGGDLRTELVPTDSSQFLGLLG